uniref:Transcription initiation factor IIE, alpha FINGER, Transcription n=1 Tax=Siphoviridae sp. ctkhg5 TaxID=2825643 RepID=A0A8S5UDI7_9CAUD|nr:MAG TPA: Transcription initiation factor IIE, alpha FINGER, Transcription [Siphoviridae sp. ctkhg5]
MTNRQEVAKKLRRIEEDVDYETAFMEIDTIIGTKDNYSFSFFFNRLADLIDPTCSLTLDEELSQELQGDMFRCDKCDAAFPRINGEYRYCPSCGARVVNYA